MYKKIIIFVAFLQCLFMGFASANGPLERDLFTAAESLNYQGVVEAIESGADVNAIGATGKSVSHVVVDRARFRGAFDLPSDRTRPAVLILRKLIAAEHDINIKATSTGFFENSFMSGKTPLHFLMVYSDNISLIYELIKMGADVNARDTQYQSTPLIEAAKMRCISVGGGGGNGTGSSVCHKYKDRNAMVGLLLSFGADKTLSDSSGKQAVDYVTSDSTNSEDRTLRKLLSVN